MGSSAMMVPTRKSLPTGRRTNKPLVEKKRRARINGCLGQLKSLLLGAMDTESAQVSRLEKADILEMTVRYLRHAQTQHQQQHPQVQVPGTQTTHPAVSTAKFSAGYTECATEVLRYITRAGCVTPDVKTRLESHLLGRMRDSVSPATEEEATSSGQASRHVNSPRKCGSVKDLRDHKVVKSEFENCHDNEDAERHYQAAVDLANMAAGFVPSASATPQVPPSPEHQDKKYSHCEPSNIVPYHTICIDNKNQSTDREATNNANLRTNQHQTPYHTDGWTRPTSNTPLEGRPLSAETTNDERQVKLRSSPNRPLHIDIPKYTYPASPTQGHSSAETIEHVDPNDDMPTLLYAYNYNVPVNHPRQTTPPGNPNYSYTTYQPSHTEQASDEEISHTVTPTNSRHVSNSDQQKCALTYTPPSVPSIPREAHTPSISREAHVPSVPREIPPPNTPHKQYPPSFIPPPVLNIPCEAHVPNIPPKTHVPNIPPKTHVPNIFHEQRPPSCVPPPVLNTPCDTRVPHVPHEQCPPMSKRPVHPIPAYPHQRVSHDQVIPGASRYLDMNHDTRRITPTDAVLHTATTIHQSHPENILTVPYHPSSKVRDINNNVLTTAQMVQTQNGNLAWQKPHMPVPMSASGTIYSPAKQQKLHSWKMNPEVLQRHFVRPSATPYDFLVQNRCGYQMALSRSWQRNCGPAYDKVWRPW